MNNTPIYQIRAGAARRVRRGREAQMKNRGRFIAESERGAQGAPQEG